MSREATQAQAVEQSNVELIEYARSSYNPLIQELAKRFEDALEEISTLERTTTP